MIPKKIHFCWLSGDEYPPLIKHCIETWHKVLPDYEIVLWDTKRFNLDSMPWVRQAFEAKKYAFAADYIRFYALYNEGGIYLDSDVEVLKSFNPLLDCKTFIGFEAATEMVEPAIVGAEPGMPWCKAILDYYVGKEFIPGMDTSSVLAPIITGNAIRATYPDFPATIPASPVKINDGEVVVCPATYFSPIKYDIEKNYQGKKVSSSKYSQNPETYCIHRFNASWAEKPDTKIQLWDLFKCKLRDMVGEKNANRIINGIRKLK